MPEISGIPIDTLKKMGFSDTDLEYILEQTEKYRTKWTLHTQAEYQGVPDHLQQQIVQIATSSFQIGMAIGIGKARNIRNAAKKFGFAP